MNVKAQPEARADPLSSEEIEHFDAHWRAANYLSVGHVYLELMTLQPPEEHPHGLSNKDFDVLFTDHLCISWLSIVSRAAPITTISTSAATRRKAR
jgi:phosphoketolase